MQSPRHSFAPTAFLLVTLAGCGGGGDSTTGPGGGDTDAGSMTATVDGQAWKAAPLTMAAQAIAGVPGGIVIVGTQVLSSQDGRNITFSLYNIGGAGTYALGVQSMVFGGIATLSDPSGAWITPLSGTAGSITITTLTASRIAGTFAFEAVPGVATTATGNRAVTSGQFDLPLKGTVTPVPDQAGSRVSATLGGSAYNASIVAVTMTGSSGLAFTSTDQSYALTVFLTGVTQPGTYSLSVSPLVGVVVDGTSGTPQPVWGPTAGDVGSITVTSLTATRAKGTFSVTLGPEPGKGSTTLVVSTGEFDVGIPQGQ